MIDWLGVAVGAMWIFGLGVLLASVSHGYWVSTASNTSFRRILSGWSLRLALGAGFVLFALGMFFSVESWWEKAGWGVVVALMVWEGVRQRMKDEALQ